MRFILQIFVAFFLLTGYLLPQNPKNFYSVRDSISSSSIYRHLKILADDSLEGRGVGSRGENIAAKYIASQFQKYGLEKIGSYNSYFQYIPMHGSLPLASSKLELISNRDTNNLKLNVDYFLYRCGQQTFIPTPLPLVFVGYGIIAPEFDYNDYQSVNVEGKIVVYIEGEPESNDKDYFNGLNPTVYSYAESKRRIALSRGAAGTILILPGNHKDWNEIKKDFDTEDVTLAYSPSSNLSIIINSETANKILYNSDYTLDDIVQMHLLNNMKSFALKTKLLFKGVFKERDFIAKNVIGLINGSDKKLNDSYLLISAHYDHLGIGVPVEGDSIYNGALDNAIGVSVLLELAHAFSDLSLKPKRSIIFVATTGEEKGLLGSSYYIDNPVVPLYKTIANINIDGVAMFRDFQALVPIGLEYSTLGDFLLQTTERYNLEIEDIPPQFISFDAFNLSDQFAFAKGGIPSILVLEGVKNKTVSPNVVLKAFINYYLYKYHTPSDDLKQEIDPQSAAKHAKVLFDFCYHLADQIQVPEWKSSSPFINARLRSAAKKR